MGCRGCRERITERATIFCVNFAMQHDASRMTLNQYYLTLESDCSQLGRIFHTLETYVFSYVASFRPGFDSARFASSGSEDNCVIVSRFTRQCTSEGYMVR